MGIVSGAKDERATYIAVMLFFFFFFFFFFFIGVVGFGRNFYYIAKPAGVIRWREAHAD